MATPKIIPYEVQLRSTKIKRNISRPVVYTNDLNSAEFQFKVIDMDAGELSTATATTLLYMRDGSFFQNPKEDVSLVGTTFSYTLKENEGNHGGLAQIQLVVTVSGMEFATQLFDFEIINGLETKVAQEVMIYDWTTLTRDAQAYIDQFVSNEATRQQQFADAQTQRSTTFGESEAGRTITFNASEAGRTTIFNASEAGRTTAFNAAEEARATGYDADHSRAGTDHTTAVNDHTLAGTDHTTAVNDHTLAGSDHTRAEADHTRADADSATVAGFNTRLTAEEIATAANKISAVKGKTFADVDARIEDVETDTTAMGTNIVINGNFSNGTSSWGESGITASVSSNVASFTADAAGEFLGQWNTSLIVGDKYYSSQTIKATSNLVRTVILGGVSKFHSGSNTFERLSFVATATAAANYIAGVVDARTSGWDVVSIKDAIVINLTAAFGKGNEPTAEQMDGIMAKFTNSWFNGTANLFRANAALNKLMAVDARTEFEANNLVSGGNVERIDTALGIWGGYKYYINAVNGNKYYVALEIKSDTPNAVRLQWSNSAVIGVLAEVNTYKRISGIITNDKPTGQTYVSATDTRSSGWTPTYTKNATVIDLTATFGAGKEPTLAEMDRLMARFPSNWFDGVKPIQTIENLYNEKANKTQEAWITPTLISGWTEASGYKVRYMKDEFGFIHLKGRLTGGTLGSPAFNLPSGYRPLETQFYPMLASGAFASGYVNSAGAVTPSGGSNINVQLDGITFRAEA